MTFNRKDLLAGLIFAGFGLAFAVASLSLAQGTALRMGPGRFPLILGGILVVIGLAIALRGFRGTPSEIGRFPWRAIFLVLGAPALFGFTVRDLGLVPSLTLVVLIASYAAPKPDWRVALPLGLLLSAACWLVFRVGLGLSLSAFGPWLGF